MENVHYNAFRDHMLGQPKKGDRDNVFNISVEQLKEYHAANYYGDNIVVVGTGNINHEELVQQVEKNFSGIQKEAAGQKKNTDKSVFIPALMFVRDDEMYNSNVGIFYDAPTHKHPDYFPFLLLKHMFGEYRINKVAEHLNDVVKQYNSMHVILGQLVDVTRASCIYQTYSDCALFGNYFFGNEVFTRQMNYAGVCLPTIYGHYLNEVEVVRGRNSLYNHLLN